MKTLTDTFLRLLRNGDHTGIETVIMKAPESPERDGLLALMYHEGIAVEPDLDRCFQYVEKATDGRDPLGYLLLGYMCDNAETPDQAAGGPRQKYDHYDAERFYELCSRQQSRWRNRAVNWLGSYFLDSAAGGDPEIGIDYLESIADSDAEAATKLRDYYRYLTVDLGLQDEDLVDSLLKWESVSARLAAEAEQ